MNLVRIPSYRFANVNNSICSYKTIAEVSRIWTVRFRSEIKNSLHQKWFSESEANVCKARQDTIQ